MKTRKTYISIIWMKLNAQIEHPIGGGKGITIDFTGGFQGNLRGNDKNGIFTTDDEELQKSIEADPGFDNLFKLYSESNKSSLQESVELHKQIFIGGLEKQGLSSEDIKDAVRIKEEEIARKKLVEKDGVEEIIEPESDNPPLPPLSNKSSLQESVELHKQKKLAEKDGVDEVPDPESYNPPYPPTNIENVPEITNTQAAKKWLNLNKDSKISNTALRPEVLEAAKEAKVNFDDWV